MKTDKKHIFFTEFFLEKLKIKVGKQLFVFLFCICHKRIQCNHYRNSELVKIFNVFFKVDNTFFQRLHVWRGNFRLRHTSVIF